MLWILVYNPTSGGVRLDDGRVVPSQEFTYADKDEALIDLLLDAKRLLEVPIAFDPHGSPVGIDPEAFLAAGEVVLRNGGEWEPPVDPPVYGYTLAQLDDLVRTGRLSPDGLSTSIDASVDDGVARSFAGPLGPIRRKLATDPANLTVDFIVNSHSDYAVSAAFYRRLMGLHTQRGEALAGLASSDYFTDGVAVGTAVFESEAANFVPSDLGKMIHIYRKGYASPNGIKIASVVDENTVTLTGNAPAGTNLPFWIGRHIISGGNNGRPAIDWFDNPSLPFPTMPYNRDTWLANNTDLTAMYMPLTNDARNGALGTSAADVFTNGRARLKAILDWMRAARPSKAYLLITDPTFLSANVGSTGHPAPWDYISDGQGNINPPGLAQAYAEGLRRVYLSFIGQYDNVDVLDLQAELLGTRSVESHPLLGDQLHLSTNTSGDLANVIYTGGGQVAAADLIARRIGLPRNGFPPRGSRRFQAEFFVYDGGAGYVELRSRDALTLASQAGVTRSDSMYVNDFVSPIALTGATLSVPAVETLRISSLAADYSTAIGKTVTIIGDHAPATSESWPLISVTIPAISAGQTVAVDVTVPGMVQGHLADGTFLDIGRGNAFRNSGLVLDDSWPNTDAVRMMIRNPTGADKAALAAENWRFARRR